MIEYKDIPPNGIYDFARNDGYLQCLNTIRDDLSDYFPIGIALSLVLTIFLMATCGRVIEEYKIYKTNGKLYHTIKDPNKYDVIEDKNGLIKTFFHKNTNNILLSLEENSTNVTEKDFEENYNLEYNTHESQGILQDSYNNKEDNI